MEIERWTLGPYFVARVPLAQRCGVIVDYRGRPVLTAEIAGQTLAAIEIADTFRSIGGYRIRCAALRFAGQVARGSAPHHAKRREAVSV